MKNRTDNGMHFDQSTAERPVIRVFSFDTQRGKTLRVAVAVPERIRKTLNSADFDFVQQELPKWHREHVLQAVQAGVFDLDLIDRKVLLLLTVRASQQLYNEFIVAQSRLGNEVWQAPPTMTHIGPSPENDDQFLEVNG